jgi:hypothetical protein
MSGVETVVVRLFLPEYPEKFSVVAWVVGGWEIEGWREGFDSEFPLPVQYQDGFTYLEVPELWVSGSGHARFATVAVRVVDGEGDMLSEIMYSACVIDSIPPSPPIYDIITRLEKLEEELIFLNGGVSENDTLTGSAGYHVHKALEKLRDKLTRED